MSQLIYVPIFWGSVHTGFGIPCTAVNLSICKDYLTNLTGPTQNYVCGMDPRLTTTGLKDCQGTSKSDLEYFMN